MSRNKHDNMGIFAHQGPNPSFSKILSDHAYQSSCFKILDADGNLIPNGTIHVGTWNLMNKCFSKETDAQNKQERNAQKVEDQITAKQEKIKGKKQGIEGKNKRIDGKTDYLNRKEKKLSDKEIKDVKNEIQSLKNEIQSLKKGIQTLKDEIQTLRDSLDKEPELIITNNPYNIDESIEEYKNRKNMQINKIIKNIRSGDDIVCLQEVDFLTTNPSQAYKLLVDKYDDLSLITDAQAKRDNIAPFELEQAKLYECQLELRARFNRLLVKENYSIFTTNDLTADQNGIAQQRFASTYSNERFDFKKGCGVLPSAEEKRNRGVEIYLFDKKLGKNICVADIHLTYGKDYNEDIEAYQQSKQDEGILHVMAGDTNNLQCIQYKTALGAWDDATNFDGVFDKRDRLTGVTTIHRETEKQKTYDRFFVVAPYNHYVTIKSNNDRNEKFVVSEKSGKIRLENTDGTHKAITGLGTPYKRGEDELRDVYQKILKLKVNSKAYDNVLDDMVEIIRRKGVKDKVINRVVTDSDINESLYDELNRKSTSKNNNNF